MADLTQERIAELRAHGGMSDDEEMELLDAAERGLTNDRKAKAFDALAAMVRDDQDFCITHYEGETYVTVGNRQGGCRSQGPTLLEAVEQLTKGEAHEH